ncbi:hypothetical protein RHSIM_Rhsim10G0025700 [Rhododendron simsii]|uniref:Uncharacterized protein n=1 Tax=Rhododendron simsii TaxID=118357 RepID=A0A834LAQ8_RHOSS|nr:hypothetical protein RHSIM_Rhsim10G0025700 [Rhododendron simsii]
MGMRGGGKGGRGREGGRYMRDLRAEMERFKRVAAAFSWRIWGIYIGVENNNGLESLSSSLTKMDPNSKEAVEARSIDILYESIGSDPYILDKADEIPFVHTPLHVAASTGQTRLAIEIMNLRPSRGRKLNPDGLSPVHLALLNGHSETAKGLVELDKDLVRVRGRERLTPLQYAAETDDRVDILAEFLCACPESIGDLNVRGETALHIAVKKCNTRALGVLMGWIRKTGKHWVKNINDERGNTILHTAVSTSQTHVCMPLVGSGRPRDLHLKHTWYLKFHD